MIEVTMSGEVTEVKEGGFTLRIHPDGGMFVRHQCRFNLNDIILMSEMLTGVCMECGEFDMSDELKAVWTLYNFDRIQRGR